MSEWMTTRAMFEVAMTAGLMGWLFLSMLFLFSTNKRRPEIDLSDLVTGENGRISLSKFAQCGAFFVSTWGFVHLTVDGHLSEWYYGAYMISWAGANLINKVIQIKEDQSATNNARG